MLGFVEDLEGYTMLLWPLACHSLVGQKALEELLENMEGS